MNEIGNGITMALYILYGVSIGAAVSSFLGITLICYKIYSARFFVHLGWCLSCAIMVIGFAMVSVLHPANGLLIEACDFTEQLLNLKSEL